MEARTATVESQLHSKHSSYKRISWKNHIQTTGNVWASHYNPIYERMSACLRMSHFWGSDIHSAAMLMAGEICSAQIVWNNNIKFRDKFSCCSMEKHLQNIFWQKAPLHGTALKTTELFLLFNEALPYTKNCYSQILLDILHLTKNWTGLF